LRRAVRGATRSERGLSRGRGRGAVAYVRPAARSDPLRLHVHAGSSFWHDGGIVLTVLGAASFIAGLATVGVSTAETDPEGALRAGIAFFVPGLVAMVVGATLWLTNGSSVVAEDAHSLAH
jgi:hypothetical protein